jgi:uncharacterized membrane protein
MIYIFLFLSASGIYFSTLLIRHSMNQGGKFVKRLCAASKNFDCTRVLDHGRMFKGLSLADIGLIFFCAQFQFIILAFFNHHLEATKRILSIGAITATMVIIILAGYQALVIKSWCKLCLALMAIILLQDLALEWLIYHSTQLVIADDQWKQAFANLLFCFLISASWLMIGPSLRKASDYQKLLTQYLRWKKNKDFFIFLLQKQRTAFSLPDKYVINLGSADAPCRVMVGLTPYCKSCAVAFKILTRLPEANPGKFCISLYFAADLEDKNGKKTKAINRLLYALPTDNPQRASEMLLSWYDSMDLSTWEKNWGRPDRDGDHNDELLELHQQWFKQNRLSDTPVIFINGYKLPSLYSVADLNRFARFFPLIPPAANKIFVSF